MSYKVYQPIYQRKEKNVKKAYFFRFLGYFDVNFSISGHKNRHLGSFLGGDSFRKMK